MFSLTLFFLLFTSMFHQALLSECMQYSTCGSCVLSSECFWCSSSSVSETKCSQYDNSQLAQFFCANNWIHADYKQCPADINQIGKDDKLSEMLDLLHQLKMKKVSAPVDHKDISVPKQDIVDAKNRMSLPTENKEEESVDSSTTTSADLKELLHKLLLLKLLRKVKNEGSATLTEEDRVLLKELDLKVITTTTTTTIKPETDSIINNELSQLIEILNSEAEEKSKKVNNEISNEIKLHSTVSTFDKKIVIKTKTLVEKQSPLVTNRTRLLTEKPYQKMTLNNHVENGGVDYQETAAEHLGGHGKHHLKNSTTTTKGMSVSKNSYCHLYLDTVLCKNDHNCTWCNSADECIHRNDHAYDLCAHTKHYDIDPCFSSKYCKQCVQDDKCYWCDVSKSCHTYPFFGYVPDACGGDWYVKQCNVQLAVIVIVLPLIMILLAMVTFYFCLKYCYYRRKILRVPLFEKPGVFDYRKDKKVYFVHPDDESSENELESERFRKKYRLPVDRAPLIDPNS